MSLNEPSSIPIDHDDLMSLTRLSFAWDCTPQEAFKRALREALERGESQGHWAIDGVVEISYEDSRQACVADIDDGLDEDDGLGVRFVSWLTGGGDHPIAHLDGKRVRAEITVLDD